MKQYSKYKDSGIEWLGKVPEHWEIGRLGTWFIERRTKVSDKEYEPLSVTKNGILPQLESAAKTNDGDNRKLVLKGDYVINSRSDRKGSSGLSSLDGSVSLINIVIQPTNINPQFCEYLFKSEAFVEEYYRNGHGIVADLWTTRYDEMKNISIVFPPLSEQQAIADFLDAKCEQIDRAVSQKERVIELLNERRQIIVQRAVTRGLNPNAPLKDSGIDWIGQIPEHWEVKRLKNNFTFGKGLNITKENLQEKGIPVINYGQVHSKQNNGVCVSENIIKYVDDKYLTTDPKCLVQKNDFIFADTSEDIEGVGNCAYIDIDETIFAGYHTIILHAKNSCSNKYLAFLFLTNCWRSQLRKLVSGIKVYSITQSILNQASILVPPLSEQQAIADYLDGVNEKIDRAINIKSEEITRMKEYRQTLINSVVTGKVRVKL